MLSFKKWIGEMIGKVGLSIFTKKVPIIKKLLERPEELMAEIYVVKDGSITITIKERETD